MACDNCHHVRIEEREGVAPIYTCHAWPPTKGGRRNDGTDCEWPIVSLGDSCGSWLHKLYDGFIPARPKDQGSIPV
jgi:hypothetical protein